MKYQLGFTKHGKSAKNRFKDIKTRFSKAFQRKKKRKISYRKTTTIGPLLIQTLEKSAIIFRD